MALGQHQKILQIVGYQNSGKTALTAHLTRCATNAGLQIATIKHHGHGGKPAVIDNKDSTLHEQAGAAISAVEGAGTLRLSITQNHWQLEDILTLYRQFAMDIILVEGYKSAHYNKVVLVRQPSDLALLHELTHIICVLYWPSAKPPTNLPCPAFAIDDKTSYTDFLLTEMRKAL